MIYSKIKHKSNSELKVFLFLGAIIIYVLGIMLMHLTKPIYAQAIQLIVLIAMAWYGSNLIYSKIKTRYFTLAFTLYMVNNSYIILSMKTLDYKQLKQYLFEDFIFWPYVIPITALIVTTPFLFKMLFKWIYWLGILSLIIIVLLWKIYNSVPITEQSIWTFSSGCGFILLTWKYHNTKKCVIAVVAVLLALYVSTIFARRNIMLTNLNFIIFSFLGYVFINNQQYKKKIIALFIIIFMSIFSIFFLQEKRDNEFKLIFNRASEDTREYVFNLYFESMKDDFLFGKGIDGTYFCPLITEEGEVICRNLIECGYLQILLKGGIINLVLFLLIMVPAIFLGIFNSNNVFSKACGILIFLWLIDMIPYGLPSFSLRYILVWVCVGICYNKEIRKFNEDSVKIFLSGSPIIHTKLL